MNEVLRKKLIIVADDYGIRETSKPILELAQKGVLDRVAVFSERVTDEDMQSLFETGVAIDIHLELIHLLKTGYEDEGSAFIRGINFIFRRLVGIVHPKKVEAEWRRQIILFRDRFGRLPDGLNSHEHVHYFPEFFSVTVALAEEFGIPRVRLGQKGIIKGKKGRLTAGILSFCSRFDTKYFRTKNIASSQWVTSFDWFADQGAFLQAMETSLYSEVEVVFHPERAEEKSVLETW
ncbi:MAG: ChbG/HpnK family deacetylase [Candidatus Moraniibacteriota bacterium]